MQHCSSVPKPEILRSERPTESEPYPKVRKIREREERVVAILQPVVDDVLFRYFYSKSMCEREL